MAIPHVLGDHSLAFLREGYRFGQHRFDRLGSDAFRTRLMLRRVTVLRGADAARFFYEGERFTRDRALPTSVLHSLQDEGSVQSLAGAAHRGRKRMFLSLVDDGGSDALAGVFRGHWKAAVLEWSARDQIELHTEIARVLTRSVCAWAGVPLTGSELDDRAGELLAMIDFAGSFGIPNWIARGRRLGTEQWARDLIVAARDGSARQDSALATIALHRDPGGELLPVDTAAIELINVLRPTVAVGRFIVFAAWALHRHPEWQRRFAAGDDSMIEEFAQEVRRFSPFFPVVGGRAARELDWRGHRFAPGDWVLLDLFATNRHPDLWTDPERFDPTRFVDAPPHYNALIPQGGGIASDGHRCPGEQPTVDLLVESIRLLTRSMDFEVPPQDLRVNLRRMPALPESGLRLTAVRPRE